MVMGFIIKQDDGTNRYISNCPHCGKEYIEEANANLSYRAYQLYKWVSKMLWLILDNLHIVRTSYNGRYEMFGDEAVYVQHWRYSLDFSEKKGIKLRPRKWWEYIFIIKPK